jgi:hypothetical protein
MKEGGHFGEFEFLLGRDIPFKIIDADTIDGWLCRFILEPEISQKNPNSTRRCSA